MRHDALRTDGHANPWTTLSQETAFENAFLSVESHRVLRPSGTPGAYGVVRVKRIGVGVLPIDDDGHVHLVGQWRYAVGRFSWEMPEGGADPEESLDACARRELEEEAGLTAGALVEALRMEMSNSLTDEVCVAYLAWDLKPGRRAPEDTEVFSHATAPFLEVLAAACDGRIRDALTIAAVLRAHHMAVSGALPARLAQAMLRPENS